MSPAERFRFEFLATLVHEGTLQPLNAWLADAPAWAEDFVAQLVADGFVYLLRCEDENVFYRVSDEESRLSDEDARILLAEGARQACNVWLAPTERGAVAFSEENARAPFEYVSDSRAGMQD